MDFVHALEAQLGGYVSPADAGRPRGVGEVQSHVLLVLDGDLGLAVVLFREGHVQDLPVLLRVASQHLEVAFLFDLGDDFVLHSEDGLNVSLTPFGVVEGVFAGVVVEDYDAGAVLDLEGVVQSVVDSSVVVEFCSDCGFHSGSLGL